MPRQLTEGCKNCMYNDLSLNTEVGRSSSSRCGCFCSSSVLSRNWPCLYLYKMCKIFLSFAVDMSEANRTPIQGTTQKVTYQAIMRRYRCYFQTGSLDSSWFQIRVPGTTASWVSINYCS